MEVRKGLEKTSKKASPFDFVAAIANKREDPVRKGDLSIDDYNPYLVNRALSHRPDAAMIVNHVNMHEGVDPVFQYMLLKRCVTPRQTRRGEFWAKSKLDEAIKIVSQYMGVGEQNAKEIAWSIGTSGVDEMRRRMPE